MSILSRKFWLSLTAKVIFMSLLMQIVGHQSLVHAMHATYEENNNNNLSYGDSGFDSDSDDSSYSEHSDTDDEYEHFSDSDSEMDSDVDTEELLTNARQDLSKYAVSQELPLKKSDKPFKSSSRRKAKRVKQKQELKRKQMLCIFLCVLIVGGAILVPTFVPFLYFFSGSSSQKQVFEDDSGLPPVPVDLPRASVQIDALNDGLASLKSLVNFHNHNLVCTPEAGGKIMCCAINDNSSLLCCIGAVCKETDFGSAPKNSYQVTRDGIQRLSTLNDRIVNKFASFQDGESFHFYNSLNELGNRCAEGKAPVDIIDKVHAKMFGTMEKIIPNMPSLQKCLKSFTFVCSDDSEIYFNPDDLRKLKKGLFKNALMAVASNPTESPERCTISMGLDYQELLGVKLTDSDLTRIIGHELAHVLQKNNYKKYYLNSEAEFERYLRENIEIEADLASQLSTKYFSKNSAGVASYLVALESYEDLFSLGSVLRIDEQFNCFDEVKKSGQHTKDLQLYIHPPLICRIAFGLSLAEAQEEIRDSFESGD